MISIGSKVRSLVEFNGVPLGTEGYVVGDYGTGIMVAWDLPEQPYPKDMTPEEVNEMWAVDVDCPLRDGFDKETELHLLQVIDLVIS